MKKLILFALCIMLGSLLFAQTTVFRTVTIDSLTLADMRNSVSNSSSEYYDEFLYQNRTSSTQQEYEPEFPDSPSSSSSPYDPGPDYLRIKHSAYLLKNAIFGSSQLTNLETINLNIASITDDLSLLSASFTDTLVECTDRALKLGYLAINASMLYDCLYHYYQNMDTSDPYYAPYDENLGKLKNVMLMCTDLMMSSEAYYRLIFENPGSFPYSYNKYQHGYWAHNFPSSAQPEHPGFSLIQYRLSMYGALGLTALLLSVTDPSMYDEMSDIVAYVDSQLVSTNVPITFLQEYQKAGMLYFHTSKSGACFEGVNYMGFLIAQLAPYFVARNRLSAGSTNYFNNQYIISWICDVTQKLSPTGEDWAYNDAKYIQEIEPSVAYAFYQNTSNNQSIDPKCSWYIRVVSQRLV